MIVLFESLTLETRRDCYKHLTVCQTLTRVGRGIVPPVVHPILPKARGRPPLEITVLKYNSNLNILNIKSK